MIELGGWPAGATVTTKVDEEAGHLTADSTGRLRLPLPAGRGEWAEVSLGL